MADRRGKAMRGRRLSGAMFRKTRRAPARSMMNVESMKLPRPSFAMFSVMVGSMRDTEYVERKDIVRCCPIQRMIWSLMAHISRWNHAREDTTAQVMDEAFPLSSDARAKRIPSNAHAARLTIAAQMKPLMGLSTKEPPEGVCVK